MPEYDAFGREIGEDPLAALRDATIAEPASESVPEPPPAPAPAPVAARPQFVRPRPRVRFTPGIVLAVLIVGAGMVAGVAVDRLESGLEGLAIEPEPSGLGPQSMIRADNLAAALATVRGTRLGRPLSLRVTTNRVDARLVARNGRQTLVRVRRGQAPQATRLRARGGTGIPYARIDVAIPERLVRDAEGRPLRFLRFDRGGWRARFR